MSQEDDTLNDRASGLVNAAAGLLSGAITGILNAPLDITKVRQQVLREKSIASNTLISIVKRDGFRGLWAGLGPTLIALTPNWGVFWWSYHRFQRSLKQSFFQHNPESSFVYILSAMGAGSCTTIVTNPLWIVKLRLQTQTMDGQVRMYRSIGHCFKTIYKDEGLKGFTKGLGPSLLGLFHVCVQFPLYENMKIDLANRSDKTTKDLNVLEIMAASVVSKVVASVAAYPHEVLRSRQQFQKDGKLSLYTIAKQTYLQEGLRGFYRGLGTNIVRTVPSCIIAFVSFEYLSKYFSNYANK